MIEDGRFNEISPDTVPEYVTKGMAEQSAALLQSVIGFGNSSYDTDHDYLTGLLSRSSGEKEISLALAETDGGLFIVDITNLRDANEKHGIVAGDRIIKTTAEALSEHSELIVARFS